MMASSASRRISTAAQPAPRRSPEAAPQRAALSVAPNKQTAKPNDRIWPALTTVSLIAIGIAFVVAGLFASDIQTQAEIDHIKREITELRDTRIKILAERAWHDSPEGLVETTTRAGLVPAPEVVLLAPLAPGFLQPPNAIDPFTPAVAADR